MAIYRTHSITAMPTQHLRDKNISLKAKGLLCYLFSIENGEQYTIDKLRKNNKDGLESIRYALRELEQAGYLVRTRFQAEDGYFDYYYDIYAQPGVKE